jgi:hypothetical protein
MTIEDKLIPPCKGRNCGATDGVSHSPECRGEHESCACQLPEPDTKVRYVDSDDQPVAWEWHSPQLIRRLIGEAYVRGFTDAQAAQPKGGTPK